MISYSNCLSVREVGKACAISLTIHLDNWHKELCKLLIKMQKESVFYTNTICYNETYFQKYLFKITSDLFYQAIFILDVRDVLKEEEKRFYSRYFSFGICGIVIEWIQKNMKESPEKIALQLRKLVTVSEKLVYEKYLEENE